MARGPSARQHEDATGERQPDRPNRAWSIRAAAAQATPTGVAGCSHVGLVDLQPPAPAILAAMGNRLVVGEQAPDFSLSDQSGQTVTLSGLCGHHVLVYFYPKADTPGCTTQACGLRDILGQIGDAKVLGISPDKPAKQAKFDQKYGLGFPLLADEDHAVAEAYGVWVQKSMYGRTYMGIERSAFLVDPAGQLDGTWYKISPKDTPIRLLEALSPT